MCKITFLFPLFFILFFLGSCKKVQQDEVLLAKQVPELLHDSVLIAVVKKSLSDLYITQYKHNQEEKMMKEDQRRASLISCFLFSIVLIESCWCAMVAVKLKRTNKEMLALRSQFKELNIQLLERIELTQKVELLTQTPQHKRKELENKMEEFFSSPIITQNNWDELELLLNKTQNGFVEKLRENYPLSKAEIQTVILIRMGNLDNNRLAILFEIQLDSLITRRYRIRKKLGVERGVDLDLFINQLFTE